MLLFFISLSPAVLATEQLTFEAALHQAESRALTLVAQDAATQSLQERALAADQFPDPVLGLSVNNVPTDGPMQWNLTDDFMTMRSVSLMQEFPSKTKRHARRQRLERAAEAEAVRGKIELVTVRQQTARAWLNCFYQNQMLDLLKTQHQTAQLQAKTLEAAYRSGQKTQAAVFQAQAVVARLDNQLQATRAALQSARIELARWVGDMGDNPMRSLQNPPRINTLTLNNSLNNSFNNTPQNTAHKKREATPAAQSEPTASLSAQLEQHPDIAWLRAKEQVAEAEVALAEQEKQVDWTGSIMYSQRGTGFSNMASIGVSLPLQWNQKNRQDRWVAAKQKELTQARALREDMLRAHHAELQQLQVSWQSDLKRLTHYDTHLIPLTEQRTQAEQVAYRSGQRPLAAVISAQLMEREVLMDRLRLEMQTAETWVDLAFLIPDTE